MKILQLLGLLLLLALPVKAQSTWTFSITTSNINNFQVPPFTDVLTYKGEHRNICVTEGAPECIRLGDFHWTMAESTNSQPAMAGMCTWLVVNDEQSVLFMPITITHGRRANTLEMLSVPTLVTNGNHVITITPHHIDEDANRHAKHARIPLEVKLEVLRIP